MMDLSPERLKRVLGPLSINQKLAFVILLCERMMPALRCFSAETDFNDSLYEECLESAWNSFLSRQDASSYTELAAECFEFAPDTEIYAHPLTSAALNAALTVGAAMGFLVDYEVDHLVEAAGLARDTAASYAQSITTVPPRSLDFNEVMAHPIVQRELRQQLNDVEFLNSIPKDISGEAISLLRDRSKKSTALLPPE